MAAIALPTTTLTDDEKRLIAQLTIRINYFRTHDIRNERYYDGRQRLAMLGLAVPPELAGFETVVNWCRVTVDEPERRLDIRGFARPGEYAVDPQLREAYEYNNLDSESTLLHRDGLALGRGFVSVNTNPDDATMPLIVIESGREIAVNYDPVRRRITAALRLYRTPDSFVMYDMGTLYLPNSTIQMQRSTGGAWAIIDRDDHNLGRVAIVSFINRRRTAKWEGESEMSDVIPLVDAASRALTNLQLAQETHAVPPRYVLGVSKGDFVDADGKQLPVWEAYLNAFMSTANKDAKIGQLSATDLTNFTSTVDFYARMVSSITGMPVRYFGQNPANPAAEGAIRADESRLIKNVERMQKNWGNDWGSVMALWLRFKTGEWVDDKRIATLWYDAGTPTFAQKADALQKLASGPMPLISREGAWDELGWSEARKDQERQYFKDQQDDAIDLGMRLQQQIINDAVNDQATADTTTDAAADKVPAGVTAQ